VFVIFGVVHSARDWVVTTTPRYTDLRSWRLRSCSCWLALYSARRWPRFWCLRCYRGTRRRAGCRRGHKSRPSSKFLRSSGTRLRGCCWARPLVEASALWLVWWSASL